MKRIITLVLFTLISATGFCQINSNIVIFSEDEKPFIMRLNGVQSNVSPQTNVRVEGIPGTTYKMRILFADTALGALNETVQIKPGFEHTFTIKPKKISAFEKKMKKVGNNLAWNFDGKDSVEMAKKRAEIENENSRYVITFISATSLATANNYSTQPAVSNSNLQPTRSNVETNTNVQGTQTQTTVTGTQPQQKSRQGGSNFSLNVNIGGNATKDTDYAEQTTTTTTTTSQPSNVVYVQGYNGPVGCNYPMSATDFQSAKSSIQSKDFEQTKYTVAKQIFDHNCLLSSQVKEIMVLFDFEQTRLDFAKYAYGRTYDTGNYYKVNDAFQFEASVDDLNRYIQSYK